MIAAAKKLQQKRALQRSRANETNTQTGPSKKTLQLFADMRAGKYKDGEKVLARKN